jgi:hypothetical protein
MCRHLVRGRRAHQAQNCPQWRGLSRGGISSAFSEQSEAGEAPAKKRLRGTFVARWPLWTSEGRQADHAAIVDGGSESSSTTLACGMGSDF